MKTITIEVEEIEERNGRFDVYLGDRYLLTSDAPLLSAARLLLEQGYDPDARLEMRRVGSQQIDLAGPLGVAAGLTVEANALGRPVFRRYRDRPQSRGAASLARETEEAAT